jgi:hypothetical protein
MRDYQFIASSSFTANYFKKEVTNEENKRKSRVGAYK